MSIKKIQFLLNLLFCDFDNFIFLNYQNKRNLIFTLVDVKKNKKICKMQLTT